MYEPRVVAPAFKKHDLDPNRPVLYLDVDGVLFGSYGDPARFQLRPGVSSFLSWAITQFRVRWLTCWSAEEVAELLRWTYASEYRLGGLPEYQEWLEFKHNGIDWNLDFYWVDDRPETPDLGALKMHGATHRLVRANPNGEHELHNIRVWLTAILEERKSDAG